MESFREALENDRLPEELSVTPSETDGSWDELLQSVREQTVRALADAGVDVTPALVRAELTLAAGGTWANDRAFVRQVEYGRVVVVVPGASAEWAIEAGALYEFIPQSGLGPWSGNGPLDLYLDTIDTDGDGR